MMRHFLSAKRQVSVDECPGCGGYELDVGKLATIRTEFATDEERDQSAAQYFSGLFDSELAAAHAETEEDLESAEDRLHVPLYLS
jgi:Zn-finger nucleic acid-binding protein